MPHTLRAIDGENGTIAELEVIVGFDDDVASEAIKVADCWRKSHPSLERVGQS